MNLPDFDFFITGHEIYTTDITITCKKCSIKFPVEGEEELGAFTPFDEDNGLKCPECNTNNNLT